MNTVTTIPSIERDNAGTLRVSSEQIADGSGVQHKNVLELIDRQREDFEAFGPLAFETRKGRPLEHGGFAKATRIALLNEQQATLLMTFQRNTEQVKAFKVALVKAFYEMAQRLGSPQLSGKQLLAAAVLEAQATIAAQEIEIAALAPKAEYVDKFVASEDLRLMRNVAKDLGLSESELRNALLDHKWIYVEHSTRWSNKKQEKVPYSRYSPYAEKREYFRTPPVHDAPRFKGEVMHTLKITPAGASAIARAVARWGLASNAHQASNGALS